MRLDGQVAIVTGGSRGLGRHISRALAEAGAHVAIVFQQQLERAEQVRDEIRSAGGRADVFRADVSCEDDVEGMVARVSDQLSRIDVLVNNAGISTSGISWKLELEDWRRVLDVNASGTFLCIKHVLPFMRSQGTGRIINIVSVVGQTGMPGTAAYSASKAAVIGLTKTIAREVANKGITVNALALGYFEEGLLYTIPTEHRAKILEQIPLGRFGDPSELTWIVRALCAPEAAYITGSVVNVNGGFYM